MQPDNLISFVEATKHLPKINGKRVHSSSVWRWHAYGCLGVKLEAYRFGARYYTTVEALERFGRELAKVEPRGWSTPGPSRMQPKARTPPQRARAISMARKRVEAAGI